MKDHPSFKCENISAVSKGTFGIAAMRKSIIADVSMVLLTVLNIMKIQKMEF